MNENQFDFKRDSIPSVHLRDLNKVYLEYTKKRKNHMNELESKETDSLSNSKNSKCKPSTLQNINLNNTQRNQSSTQSIHINLNQASVDQKLLGSAIVKKDLSLVQQSFLSNYTQFNHKEKRKNKKEKHMPNKENYNQKCQKRQATRKYSSKFKTEGNDKPKSNRVADTLSLLSKKEKKVYKEDLNEYGTINDEPSLKHNESQTSQELKEEYMKLKRKLKTIEQTQSQDSSIIKPRKNETRRKDRSIKEDHCEKRQSKSHEGRNHQKKKNKSQCRKDTKKEEIVELFINLDGKHQNQLVVNEKGKVRKSNRTDKRNTARSIDERNKFRSDLGATIQQFQNIHPNYWSPAMPGSACLGPISPRNFPQVNQVQPIYNQLLVPQIIQIPQFQNFLPASSFIPSRTSIMPQGLLNDINQPRTGYLSHRTSLGGNFLNFNNSNHFRGDSTQIINTQNFNKQVYDYSSDKNAKLDNTLMTFKVSPRDEHQRELSSTTSLRGPKTESVSLQCSLNKDNSQFKSGLDSKLKHSIMEQQLQLSNQQNKNEKRHLSKFSAHKKGSLTVPVKTVITEESASNLNSKKCSFFIAENVLESPKERDYRDNKNVNIYMINEMEVMCKPGHHDFEASTPYESKDNRVGQIFFKEEQQQVNNSKLTNEQKRLNFDKIEIQFKDESTRQITSGDVELENSIHKVHSQVQFNKKPKESEEPCFQVYTDEFSNDSFLEIPQERKSLRRMVNFYQEDESEKRIANLHRQTLCRSKSEQKLDIIIPTSCHKTSDFNNTCRIQNSNISNSQFNSTQKSFFQVSTLVSQFLKPSFKTNQVSQKDKEVSSIDKDLTTNSEDMLKGTSQQSMLRDKRNARSRMSNFSNNQTITSIPFNKTGELSLQESFKKENKGNLVVMDQKLANQSLGGSQSQRNSLAEAFFQKKSRMASRLESEKRKSLVSQKVLSDKEDTQSISQRDQSVKVQTKFQSKIPVPRRQLNLMKSTQDEEVKKVTSNQLQALDRLVRGLKAEINMVDIKKKTTQTYNKLPEQKMKKQNEERKSIARQRIDNIKAFDKKMRGKQIKSTIKIMEK